MYTESLFRLLANNGRNGDTDLRVVSNQLSHVNPGEAQAIDKYGRAGEIAVQNMGAGTINPITGLPEYHSGKWWDITDIHPMHHWKLNKNPIADLWDETVGVKGLGGWIQDNVVDIGRPGDWKFEGGDMFTKDFWSGTGWVDNTLGKRGLLGGLGDVWDQTMGKGGLWGGLGSLFSNWASEDNYLADKQLGVTEAAVDRNIDTFKDQDFHKMTDIEQLDSIRTFFDNPNISMTDLDKFYNPYDPEGERQVMSDTAANIGSLHQDANTGLMGLIDSTKEAHARSGFANTGNPMIDSNRRSLFGDASLGSKQAWNRGQEDIRNLQDAYNYDFMTNALTHYSDLTGG